MHNILYVQITIGNLVFPPSTATSEELMAWTLTYEGATSASAGLISGVYVVVAGVFVLVSVVIIIVLLALLIRSRSSRKLKVPDTK